MSHITLLLVEDNPGDAELVEECLSTLRVSLSLHVVRDGVAALRFARRVGEYSNAPRPTVIFLDLNLPKKDGREVLSEIKADPQLRCIPVVVMTSSEAPRDISMAYSLHANCYVTKSGSFSGTLDLIQRVGRFWFETARLPD